MKAPERQLPRHRKKRQGWAPPHRQFPAISQTLNTWPERYSKGNRADQLSATRARRARLETRPPGWKCRPEIRLSSQAHSSATRRLCGNQNAYRREAQSPTLARFALVSGRLSGMSFRSANCSVSGKTTLPPPQPLLTVPRCVYRTARSSVTLSATGVEAPKATIPGEACALAAWDKSGGYRKSLPHLTDLEAGVSEATTGKRTKGTNLRHAKLGEVEIGGKHCGEGGRVYFDVFPFHTVQKVRFPLEGEACPPLDHGLKSQEG